MSDSLEIFVACLPGLEPFVAQECTALGAALDAGESGVAVGSGGVPCRGDRDTVMRLNLGLGCASHVLVRIARFRARHFAELQKRAESVAWGRWLRADVPFDVRATSRRSKLFHTGGIVERIAAAIAVRTRAASAAGGVAVHARFEADICTVSIDTSGRALHERGWRLESAKAPLREDLAHALVLASGWDPSTSLVDPFCGSGTIPIVAAGIARRVAPGGGGGREFAFERLLGFGADAWNAVRERAASAMLPRAPAPIYGSDRDAGAVAIASRNAMRAGLDTDVTFAAASLSDAPGLSDGVVGAVVTNPPFGRRVGQRERLVPLYQALGAMVRATGARAAILCDDRRLAMRTGLGLRSAFLSNHGGLRVRGLVS